MTTGDQAAKALSDFVNNFNCDQDEFVKAVMRDHRTIQQSIFDLMRKCIVVWAERGPYQYDARNEYTIAKCKEIVEKIEDMDLRCPMI